MNSPGSTLIHDPSETICLYSLKYLGILFTVWLEIMEYSCFRDERGINTLSQEGAAQSCG